MEVKFFLIFLFVCKNNFKEVDIEVEYKNPYEHMLKNIHYEIE